MLLLYSNKNMTSQDVFATYLKTKKIAYGKINREITSFTVNNQDKMMEPSVKTRHGRLLRREAAEYATLTTLEQIQQSIKQKSVIPPELKKDGQKVVMDDYIKKLEELYDDITNPQNNPSKTLTTWLTSHKIDNKTLCGEVLCYEVLSCIEADNDLNSVITTNEKIRNLRTEINAIKSKPPCKLLQQ